MVPAWFLGQNVTSGPDPCVSHGLKRLHFVVDCIVSAYYCMLLYIAVNIWRYDEVWRDMARYGEILFFNKKLIRNGTIPGQGPPGGDEEDLAQEAREAEIGGFLIGS